VQDKVRAREAGLAEREAAAVWVAGEPASVEVEIRNPTASAIKARAPAFRVRARASPLPGIAATLRAGPRRQVEKLTVEAAHTPAASVAPRDQAGRAKAAWKPNPVAMWLPAATSPTKARAAPGARQAPPAPPRSAPRGCAGGAHRRAAGRRPAHAGRLPAHRAGRDLAAALDAARGARARRERARRAGGGRRGAGKRWRPTAAPAHAALLREAVPMRRRARRRG